MNATIYVFGRFEAGHSQYPNDYTSEIFEKMYKNANSPSQLIVFRQGNLMYYAFVEKLENEKFLGFCVVLNDLKFKNEKKLFSLFEKVEFDRTKSILDNLQIRNINSQIQNLLKSANLVLTELEPLDFTIENEFQFFRKEDFVGKFQGFKEIEEKEEKREVFSTPKIKRIRNTNYVELFAKLLIILTSCAAIILGSYFLTKTIKEFQKKKEIEIEREKVEIKEIKELPGKIHKLDSTIMELTKKLDSTIMELTKKLDKKEDLEKDGEMLKEREKIIKENEEILEKKPEVKTKLKNPESFNKKYEQLAKAWRKEAESSERLVKKFPKDETTKIHLKRAREQERYWKSKIEEK